MSQLETALEYAGSGLPVFPCNGKIPAVAGGFKDASTDTKKVTDWFSKNPSYSIGLAAGRSSGFSIVDIDNKDGRAKERLATWPATHTVATPSGGFHLYYHYTPDLKTGVRVYEETDIRNDGSYVIAAGSPGYEVSGDYAIAPFPMEKLPRAKTVERPAASGDVVEGGRNHYLAQVAGRLQRAGLSYEALLAALRAENEARLVPPLDEREVATVAASIARYDPEAPIEIRGPSFTRVTEDLVKEMLDYLNNKEGMTGESTGIASLDRMLGGGLRLGELTVLNAPAKTGKSTLMHFIIHSMLSRGVDVGYASREMSPGTEVLPNLLSVELGRNMWTQPPNKTELGKIFKWPLYFSAGYGTIIQSELERYITEIIEQGARYVFIDHLHYLMENPEDFQEVSRLIKAIKTWTKEYNIHAFLVVQPPKLMDGQELGINTLRGGAALGQALDNLLTLERVKEHRNVSKISLPVARHKMAEPGTIYMLYNKDTMRFEEAEWADESLKLGALDDTF